MSSALPLHFLNHVTDPVILICEGTPRPVVGQRVRAIGSEGNGLLVVVVLEPEELPGGAGASPERFGIKLQCNELPWPPNTRIEIIGR